MANSDATVVGQSILISGNLEGDEDLTVLGRVHGNVTLTKTLMVEESGIVKADVNVRNAVVSGIVVGNITASDSVELTDQGRVVGDIRAPRIIIVDGARFRGNVDMGDLDAPRASAPLPPRVVSKTAMTSTPMPARATGAPSAPPRRTMPPPPPPLSRPSPEASTAGTGAKRPVAAKKKIKKKVVVKKKGR